MANLHHDSVHVAFQFSVVMARFIGLFFALALSKHLLLEVSGQYQCSSLGTKGLSGCECLFLGTCDVHGKPKDSLNIADHLPLGLEQFGHPSTGSNLAYLCEGHTVGILYDCNNRIPLYAATVIRGSQLSGADGNRPTGAKFRLSENGLHEYFQQSNKDYDKASQRKICFFKRSFRKEIVDAAWHRAKNSKMSSSDEACTGGSNDLKTEMHKGHLIASQYGVGDQTLKKATFVYTNAVPQFGDFNSAPWRIAESELVVWGRNNCASNGKQNVQMFIVVGVIPSTTPVVFGGSIEPRYFGKNGFSDYQDDTDYRVNVPEMMWTAACCTFQFTENGETAWQRGVRSTAFWRENEPGTRPVDRGSVTDLVWMLKSHARSQINLFPYSDECTKSANHGRI